MLTKKVYIVQTAATIVSRALAAGKPVSARQAILVTKRLAAEAEAAGVAPWAT